MGSPVGLRSSAPDVLPGSVLRWKDRTSCQTRPRCGSFHVMERSAPERITVLGGDAACPSVKAFSQATPDAVAARPHSLASASFRSGVCGCSSLVGNGWGELQV